MLAAEMPSAFRPESTTATFDDPGAKCLCQSTIGKILQQRLSQGIGGANPPHVSIIDVSLEAAQLFDVLRFESGATEFDNGLHCHVFDCFRFATATLPFVVDLAIKGLQILNREEAVAIDKAIAAGEKAKAVAEQSQATQRPNTANSDVIERSA
jgi:hypothetical protein